MGHAASTLLERSVKVHNLLNVVLLKTPFFICPEQLHSVQLHSVLPIALLLFSCFRPVAGHLLRSLVTCYTERLPLRTSLYATPPTVWRHLPLHLLPMWPTPMSAPVAQRPLSAQGGTETCGPVPTATGLGTSTTAGSARRTSIAARPTCLAAASVGGTSVPHVLHVRRDAKVNPIR